MTGFVAVSIATILAVFQHAAAMRCPPMGVISPSQIGASCSTSRTCPPRAQCCNTIHGMRCVELVDGSSPSLGMCSDGSAATQSCNPGACPPNYKCENGRCCWNNPYGPPPRPSPAGGTCEDGSLSTVRCSSHSECTATQKCYGKWCCPNNDQSYRKCNDGSTSTMKCPGGICPVGRACEMGWCCTQGSIGGGQCEDGSFSNKRCSSHNQCRVGEKCYGMWCCPLETETYRQCNDGSVSTTRCPSGICSFGKACEMGWCCTQNSGNAGSGMKPGRCPHYMSIPGQLANHLCYSDAECQGRKKCCGTALGRRCLLPEM